MTCTLLLPPPPPSLSTLPAGQTLMAQHISCDVAPIGDVKPKPHGSQGCVVPPGDHVPAQAGGGQTRRWQAERSQLTRAHTAS
jgi:hypothetical protein